MLCRNPAQHFLLDDRKGSFAVGKDADSLPSEINNISDFNLNPLDTILSQSEQN
ncbi:TPA: amidohydrolase family protein [Klebsiella pneumoniae]|nr:amidohydrolase family protein [Klebsiella pneumoniae]HBR1478584.1 amidohydrolase family protein [Klebsiella pneumoniae]